MPFLLQAAQAAQTVPEPVTVDWQPLVTALVLIVPTFGAILAVFLGWLRSLVLQQKETFTFTIAHNRELELSLTAATLEITRLGVIAQTVEGLKSEVARLQTDYTSLRTASDLERQAFKERSTDYQKRIDADAEIIKTLQQSVESLTNEVTDLKDQVKSLIEQRDRLQDDKAARVEMSKHGADTATLERMMSDAKAAMIQESDSEPPGEDPAA